MIPSPPETRASLILRLPDAADVAAWDQIVAIYGPLVYRMGLRQGLQAADADDLVQEVFTAVARSVSQWLERSDRGKFRAWLLTEGGWRIRAATGSGDASGATGECMYALPPLLYPNQKKGLLTPFSGARLVPS